VAKTALEYLDSLAMEASGDASLQRELAEAYLKVGDVQGHVFTANLGNTSVALESYGKALELAEPLLQKNPGNLPLRTTVALGHEKMGDVYTYTGDMPKALTHYERLVTLREALTREPDGSTLANQLELIKAYRISATVNIRLQHLNEAKQRLQQAIQLAEKLAEQNPDSSELQSQYAVALNVSSGLLLRENDPRKALEGYRKSLQITEALVKKHPSATGYQRDLMVLHGHMGDILGSPTKASLGDTAGAIASYGKAVSIAKAMVAADPKDKRAAGDYAIALMRFGNTLPPSENRQALQVFRQSTEIFEALAESDAKNIRLRLNMAYLYGRFASRLADAGDAAGARKLAEKGITMGRLVYERDPKDSDAARAMLGSFRDAIATYTTIRDRARILALAKEGVEVAEGLAATRTTLNDHIWRPRSYGWRGKAGGPEACHWYVKSRDAWSEVQDRFRSLNAFKAEIEEARERAYGCQESARATQAAPPG
jgi:tetratricopeptide (TPR) repeat protein